MKILIADDDKISREYLLKLLSRYGECDITKNGIEAVDAFIMAVDDIPYDLLCLDIMMPIYDGVKVLKTIRNIERKRNIELKKKVTVFITTALNDSELIAELSKEGFEAYITKPIHAEKLIELMDKYFN